jgi:3-oxoacyl-[acyl-carrier protein] reductase
MGSEERFRLDGRNAIVTGSGSGIGQAIAIRLAGAGANVTCADINEERANETKGIIDAEGGSASIAVVDVTKKDDVTKLVNGVRDLAIMCNNAGIMTDSSIVDLDEADLDRIFAVNFKGVFYGAQAAARVMVARGSGVIINTSSGAVAVPAPNIGAYAMAKAAVSQMTKTLAIEIAPSGVRVNAIAPGFVDTRITARHYTEDDGSINDEKRNAIRSHMSTMAPLRIMGEADDMAYAVLYLASDAAKFVTGQTIHPNGGVAMNW